MMKWRLIWIFLLLMCQPLYATLSSFDDYFRSGIGARALAMGRAQTALSNDASTMVWNPALLPELSHKEWMMFASRTFGVVDQQYLGLALPLKWGESRFIGLGAGYFRSALDGFVETTLNGEETGESFGFEGTTAILSAGMYLGDIPYLAPMSIGVTYKSFQESLANQNAKATAYDLGLMMYLSRTVRFGAVIENLVADEVKWSTGAREDLAQAYRLALAYDGLRYLSTSVEVLRLGNDNKIHAGLEWRLFHSASFLLALRGGYADGDISAGVGLGLGRMTLDYAYVLQEKDFIDAGHYVSLKKRF